MKSFIDCLAFKSDDFTFEKFDAISDNLEIFNEWTFSNVGWIMH